MNANLCKRLGAVVLALAPLCAAGGAAAQTLPVMEAVVGNNFGHLPMSSASKKAFSGSTASTSS